MNACNNHFRSPSAQRIWERDYQDKVASRYSTREVFEFLSAESRGDGSLAAEIAKGYQKFCDLVVIRSVPDAVLITLVKEYPAVDFDPTATICGSKFIGRDLGQSLLLYMGRIDGRYARLFLHPESTRYIDNHAKHDPSTNTVTVNHTLMCPMVTIHYSSAPRPLTNP